MTEANSKPPVPPVAPAGEGRDPAFRVEDKRHWARQIEDKPEDDASASAPSTVPTIVDEYRLRAESAERKLLEYISAFKAVQAEQERLRERLERDLERRAVLRFGGLAADLLDCLDDLDLALAHAAGLPEAVSLATGVSLARDRFLAALKRQGVERLSPDGEDFDPNLAEAVRVDTVEDPQRSGKVTETIRPGYRLGDRLLRPARVAVARHEG